MILASNRCPLKTRKAHYTYFFLIVKNYPVTPVQTINTEEVVIGVTVPKNQAVFNWKISENFNFQNKNKNKKNKNKKNKKVEPVVISKRS